RHDLLAKHAQYHPAAGLPQHDPGTADADHRAVPGYLAGLRDIGDGLPRRRLEDCATRWPAGRNVSVRRRRLLHYFTRGFRMGAEAPAPHRHRARNGNEGPVIAIDNVSKWYTDFQVLKDCSTSVAKGEVVIVCGPSGSGKSTLIKCVNGLEPFQQGRIVLDGIK